MADAKKIERLEERKWAIMNSFGEGCFRDGLKLAKIKEIDDEITSLRSPAHET